MSYQVNDYLLRKPELNDLDAFYIIKNDPEIAGMVVGFSIGYSKTDINDWIEYHKKQKDEIFWVIAEKETNRCIGHVGIYQIDYRVRKAEFGIIIGEKSLWGKGLGLIFSKFAIEYAFNNLNLMRIQLTVLATNERAYQLYKSLEFKEEGRLRRAQYKEGQYIDIAIMGLLKEDYYNK